MAKAHDKFRTAEIAKIHIARAQTGIDDATYRAMVAQVSGGKRDSAANLDWRQRRDLLELFKDKGWKPRHTGKKPAQPSRPLADYPEARMIRGLWIELHQLHRAGAAKAVRDPSEKSLNAFVKRMTRVEDLHWLQNSGRVDHVIEALKAWTLRARQELFFSWQQHAWPDLDRVMQSAALSVLKDRHPIDILPEEHRQEMHPAIYALLHEYTTEIHRRYTAAQEAK